MTLQELVKFTIKEVHNRDDRIRIERRRRRLVTQYSVALGGIHTLDQQRRVDVEKAAELVSLLELAWVFSGGDDETPEDASAFVRLGKIAAEAVTKLGLPMSTSGDPAISFGAAVDGLMSKSAATP
jgi:hypothetical protein